MEGIGGLGEGAKGGLHLDLDSKLVFLRLVEADDQPAFLRVQSGLDIPGEELFALHAGDFASAAHEQDQARHFTLHDFALDQRRLANQAGADAELREHLDGIKQFALALCPGLFPGQLHLSVRGQITQESVALALGSGGVFESELGIGGQALEHDRL